MTNNRRNFCIIAHIDHGKSTLADRILELSGLVGVNGSEQVLDGMELERERGITIKSSPIRIPYRAANGEEYILNLIDTPGHVDFNYEVSRSLRACEGAILLVDATQGVQAQTVANAYRAIDAGLEIIPVINKIDMPAAMIDDCCLQFDDILGIAVDAALTISAKKGTGVPELLEDIITKVPPPQGNQDAPLKSLIFDSQYDPYRGVIMHVRVFSGSIKAGDRIMLKSNGKTYEVEEVGYFGLRLMPCEILAAGEVGYVSAMVRTVADINVGDTIVSPDLPQTEAISGFRRSQPVVFCGLYPTDSNDYVKLRVALEKLQLNDSSIVFEKESSAALGNGFRVGFLGMLHMDITLERLRREYEQELIATLPSVVYKVTTTKGQMLHIDNPSKFPTPQEIEHIEEPMVRAHLMTPTEFVGPCMELAKSKRGIMIAMEHPDQRRTLFTFDFPLAEIIVDFHDRLKSTTKGYASMDYEMAAYHAADLVKVDILINGDPVDALSYVCVRQGAPARGRALIAKLRELIPRQQFRVPLQAAIGGNIVAREDIPAIRKDVLAKCYGGDVTRKRKLLEKQKEGKKRMKMVGSVEVPQEAFFSLLKVDQ